MNNVVPVTECTLQTWSYFPCWNFNLSADILPKNNSNKRKKRD